MFLCFHLLHLNVLQNLLHVVRNLTLSHTHKCRNSSKRIAKKNKIERRRRITSLTIFTSERVTKSCYMYPTPPLSLRVHMVHRCWPSAPDSGLGLFDNNASSSGSKTSFPCLSSAGNPRCGHWRPVDRCTDSLRSVGLPAPTIRHPPFRCLYNRT